MFLELKTVGIYRAAAKPMTSFDAFNTLVGLEKIVEAECRGVAGVAGR